MMLQSRLSAGTKLLLSVAAAPLLLPLGVAGTTPSSMSEPAPDAGDRLRTCAHRSGQCARCHVRVRSRATELHQKIAYLLLTDGAANRRAADLLCCSEIPHRDCRQHPAL